MTKRKVPIASLDGKMILGDLYLIMKEAGIMCESEEGEAFRAAFILGQKHFRDVAIDRLGDYDALQCAQVVAGIALHSGLQKII